MRNSIRTVKARTLVIALAAVYVAWPLSASIRGHIVGRLDVARGQYTVRAYGLPGPFEYD